MSNISSLCYNPTPQNGATTEINFPIADAEVRKAIYTDSLRTYIGLPATPAISIDSSNNNNNTFSFWPSNNNTQVPLILQGNNSPSIPNDSTLKIINRENTEYTHYLVKNSYEDSLIDYLSFQEQGLFKHLFLGTSRKINGTWIGNEITLSVKEDGTKSVTLTNPTAWRKAFGIKDLGLVESAPGDSKSIPNNSTTNLCSKTFSVGTWLIQCTATFPSASGKQNDIYLAKGAGATGSLPTRVSARSNSVGVNSLDFTTIKQFTSSETWYLNVYQNSGSAQNVYGGIKAVKICDFVP